MTKEKSKKPQTVKEQLEEFKEFIAKFMAKHDKNAKEYKSASEKSQEILMSYAEKNSDTFVRMGDQLRKCEKTMAEVRKTTRIVDETLCNVLLAIRQNEYLQAWYPAQSGFDEMKVAGIHPANVKKEA